MRLLIFEYITGGGLRNEVLPASLAAEGDLMLHALVDDLVQLPAVEMVVPRDSRLGLSCSLTQAPAVNVLPVEAGDALLTHFDDWIDNCDAVWPVAPESGGVLQRLCAAAEARGKFVLNSDSRTVGLAASKLQTAMHLQRAGIPVVPSSPLKNRPSRWPGPWVVKPDDGVGCDGCRVVRESAELERLEIRAERELIVQPWLMGEPLSLSALFCGGRAELLCCNRQLITVVADRFRLEGCLVNALSDDDGALHALTEAIAAVLPGLWGYAGVDLIREGEVFRVLEINPRLTSSYAGLNRALGINVAASILTMAEEGRLDPPRPRHSRTVEVIFAEGFASR